MVDAPPTAVVAETWAVVEPFATVPPGVPSRSFPRVEPWLLFTEFVGDHDKAASLNRKQLDLMERRPVTFFSRTSVQIEALYIDAILRPDSTLLTRAEATLTSPSLDDLDRARIATIRGLILTHLGRPQEARTARRILPWTVP